MKDLKISSLSLTFAALSVALQANASTGSCAAGLTTNPVRFESAIQYDDMQSKSNPTVHVLINGKAVKMLLDTGANVSSLWDASLLDEMPSPRSVKFDALVVSVDARRVEATLGDNHGNSQRQEFALLSHSALAADGLSGVLSPQAVARHNAVVIDFEKDCFFTSPPFDIPSDNALHVRRGTTIPNPYDVMAISVELDERKIPLVVDSGSVDTLILASLAESKPEGPKSRRSIDMFGAEVPRGEQMRLVDLKINGQTFSSHPVVTLPTLNDLGVGEYGYIGMDILKDRVIYHDGTKQEFILITRQQVTKQSISERETRTE